MPRDDARYVVRTWHFEPGGIEATYVVNVRLPKHEGNSYKCLFHVDLKTGEISKLRKIPITEEEMLKLIKESNYN